MFGFVDVLMLLFVVVVVVAGQRRLREICGFLASAHWLSACRGFRAVYTPAWVGWFWLLTPLYYSEWGCFEE